jgi:hypothetical protein
MAVDLISWIDELWSRAEAGEESSKLCDECQSRSKWNRPYCLNKALNLYDYATKKSEPFGRWERIYHLRTLVRRMFFGFK